MTNEVFMEQLGNFQFYMIAFLNTLKINMKRTMLGTKLLKPLIYQSKNALKGTKTYACIISSGLILSLNIEKHGQGVQIK